MHWPVGGSSHWDSPRGSSTGECCLPHIYIEHEPFTIPEPLHGEIMKPDSLVGIPSIGTIAVDVKAKRVNQVALIIDA